MMLSLRDLRSLTWDYNAFTASQTNGALLAAPGVAKRYVIYVILISGAGASVTSIESPAGTDLIQLMNLAGDTIQAYSVWKCPENAAVVTDTTQGAVALDITLGFRIEDIRIGGVAHA